MKHRKLRIAWSVAWGTVLLFAPAVLQKYLGRVLGGESLWPIFVGCCVMIAAPWLSANLGLESKVASRKFAKRLAVCLAIFNSPGLFLLVPLLGPFGLLAYLYWVNTPGIYLWRHLGESYYHVHSFGVTPKTPLAWGLVSAFWSLIALIVATISFYLPEPRWHFTTRTLLIATTLVAISLGAAVYFLRGPR